MIINFDDFEDFIKNKKVALFGVNKDLVNLLKYNKMGLITLDYSIVCVIDFTLGYRNNIRQIVEECIADTDGTSSDTPSIEIVSSFERFKTLLDEKAFDIFLNFEEGGQHSGENRDPVFLEIDTYEEKLREKYFEYIDKRGIKGEFNYKYGIDEILTINSYITNRYNVHVMSALSQNLWVKHEPECFNKMKAEIEQNLENYQDVADIPSFIADKLTDSATLIDYSNDASIKTNLPRVLYNRDVDIKNLKPVFVLGSDYGVGKANFIREKYNGLNNVLLNDTYYMFVNPNVCVNRIKEVSPILSLLDNIARLGETQKGEIYVKIEGQIEEFAFGIPKDRYAIWGNFHEYFIKPKFVVIIKENEDMVSFERTLSIFKRRMNLTNEHIEIYKSINNSASFEKLEID